MQLLEGEKKSVLAFYGTIVSDRRHSQVHLLRDRAVTERSFKD